MATSAPAAHAPPTLLAAEAAAENLALMRRYLAAMERGVTGDALAEFFTDDVVSIERPNRLAPDGATRDLAAMRAAAERGRRACTRQRYEVRTILAIGDRVAVEVEWIGTLAVPLGTIPAGGEMRAHFAAFYTLRGGRIAEIRNYDCFEPF